jgi:acetyl esterase/lipase
MSSKLSVYLLLFAVLLVPGLQADPVVVNLWPGVAPGSENASGDEIWKERGQGIVDRSVANVHVPTVTVYRPLKEVNTGAAIVIYPGGAYTHLAIDKEGHDVGKWLAAHGVTGLVTKYRLPKTENAGYSEDTAHADAVRAMRLARSRAEEWGIDPRRIGAMGFSAGGHLTMLTGTRYDGGDASSPDPVEHFGSRPDFLVPVYPLTPKDVQITKDTPPSFLVHADDDRLSSENSVTFYLGLKKAGVPAELHIFSEGGHGFGIRNRGIPASSWPQRLLDWLAVMDIVRP